MNIAIELPEKFEKPLETVVEQIGKANPDIEVNTEKLLSSSCMDFIRLEYSKFLMMDENPEKEL